MATAARLAKAGFNVTVIEKNTFTGGRCSLIHHEGYVRLSLNTAAPLTDLPSASTRDPLSCSSPSCLLPLSRT